jgi:cell division protein FtsI (penicillin-binding protein 3)
VWTVAVEGRLVHLQVVEHASYLARAARQQKRVVVAPAKRGDLVDRRGRTLASSVEVDSLYAVPAEVGDAARAADVICAALERCDDRERQSLLERLGRSRPFVYLRRHLSPAETGRIGALGLTGIFFLKEDRRIYPNSELAAHVLGYVGLDNVGLGGTEAVYDRLIRGQDGSVLVHSDAKRRAFSRVDRPPTAGVTLELTIDYYLQHVAERELRAAVARHGALGGTAIIMEPWTGEILALANEPTFNPNVSVKAFEVRRNRAIQEVYEPGSTFKIVTASAALDERVVDPESRIDVSEGAIRFGPRRIEDVHRYGVLSFTDVIVKSSNVGAIKVGLRLGPDRLGRYVRRFGFGQTLSRDFRGESAGIVWDFGRLDDSALASVAMGYQIGVTPVQMAAAVSAIANGGDLVEPRVVRALIRGGVRHEQARHVLRRAITPETAAELTRIMEAVVERGTARAAALEGYTCAGKTGTAAKLIGGRYSRSQYNASFVGFVPSRNPAFTILVVLDSPSRGQYYGGAVAAPVFKAIAEATLRHAGIGPVLNAPPPVLVVRRSQPDEEAIAMPVVAPLAGMLSAIPPAGSVMPELRGQSAREALRALARVGLTARLAGDGVVIAQDPPAGTPIEPGHPATLRLGRHRAALGGSTP